MLLVLVGLGYGVAQWNAPFTRQAALVLAADVRRQRDELTDLRDTARAEIASLSTRLGRMQARMMRLDALGERVVSLSGIEAGEFDFDQAPGVGGLETAEDGVRNDTFYASMTRLERRIARKGREYGILEEALLDRRFEDSVFVAGRPAEKGWLSSRFGYRIDPFNGKRAWHNGIDFAGVAGTNVTAVASGVVVWAAPRYGYGNLVEINHGNGYVTRYAHNAELLVKQGDIVEKGEVIGTMGHSGRATGPHVHFEVWKDGRAVDAARFVSRGHRKR